MTSDMYSPDMSWPTLGQREGLEIARHRTKREELLRAGTWVDISRLTVRNGFFQPACISRVILYGYGYSVNDPDFETHLSNLFKEFRTADRRYKIWRSVLRTNVFGFNPDIRIIFSQLEDGEEVITIFEDPSPPPKGYEEHVVKRLPTPDELTSAARMTYCDPDAPMAKRKPGPPGMNHHVTTAEFNEWLEITESLAMQAMHDPVTTALVSEEIGAAALASDCWVLAGDLDGALDVLSPTRIGHGGGGNASYRLCLSIILKRPIAPADVFPLFLINVTPWGRKHPDQMAEVMQEWLDAQESRGQPFESWILSQKMQWLPWKMHSDRFPGYVSGLSTFSMPMLYNASGGSERMQPVHREIENITRARAKVPLVGQGWISETELFNLLLEEFGEQTSVVQHGHPLGFERQHLDVWMPEWNIGVEYQGLQHDQPIGFFGGEEAWKANAERDQRKRHRCQELGIRLIEVRPGYEIEGLLQDIRSSIPEL